jgi:hypothetical protein
LATPNGIAILQFMHTQSYRPVRRLLTIIGILAICLGASSSSCSWSGSNDDDDDDDDDGNNGQPSFVTTLELRNVAGDIVNTFDRGERIEMTLSVRNRLDSQVEVDFETTRTSDFVVVDENTDDVVWKWSEGQGPFDDIETMITFEPGETQTFTASWDQRGASGNQVRADTYEARGVLVYDGFDSNPLQSNQLGSNLVRFTIE